MAQAKKDDTIDNIVGLGLLALGGYLLIKFIKNLNQEDVSISRCSYCGFILREKISQCPNCHNWLQWGK